VVDTSYMLCRDESAMVLKMSKRNYDNFMARVRRRSRHMDVHKYSDVGSRCVVQVHG
jgi:hypothetical protein